MVTSACGLGQGAAHWVAALLTLSVLSYLLGENVVFHSAEHLLVGVAAGYAAGITCSQVLWPRIQLLWVDPGQYWYYAPFLGIGLLMLLRGHRQLSSLADIPLSIIFGVGAGLVLTGSFSGTLLPQIRAAMVSLAPSDYGGGLRGWAYALDALLLLACTLAVFATFYYRERKEAPIWLRRPLHVIDSVGRSILAVAFGALFALATITFFALLRGRLVFLLSEWLPLIPRGS